MREEELVSEAQQGGREALLQLLHTLETPMYRTAYYMLGNEQDALDVTQEALMKVYQNIGHFKREAKVTTWAQRIVHNVSIDYMRKRKSAISIDQHEHVLNESGRNDVEEQMEQKMVSEDIQEAVGKLPEHFRQVVVLRFIHDYSYQEIVEAMDLPLNTIKSHLFRARQQLKKLLLDGAEGGV